MDRVALRALDVLGAVAEELAAPRDLAESLEAVLTTVARAVQLRTAWIWLLDEESGRFYHAASIGLPPFLREPVEMTHQYCWCIQAFFAGDFRTQNVGMMECSRLRSGAERAGRAATRGLRYHASVALRSADRDVGIMNLTGADRRRIGKSELQLLSVVGQQVGAAVERARLHELAVIAARSEERSALARTLHDTLAQDLTAIGLQLEGARRALGADRPRAQERLERALEVARAALVQTRDAVATLRDEPLAGKPLSAALLALGRTFSAESGLRVHPHIDESLALEAATERELFHIASEALTNVRRHARASTVRIVFERRARHIRLSIVDDGVGYTKTRAPGHYGVLGMQERARVIGARFSIGRRRDAAGTRVTVEIA
jgi:two-component system NarL family sensor kinase